MLGDWSCKVLLLLLGYAYPAYKTFKVVQLPATRSNDTLLRHWCQFWALMAAFTTVQPLVDTFCFWLPLYYEAKLVAAIYLWCNDLAGAQHVWSRWAQPLASRYEPLVDRWLAESKALAREWLQSNAMRLLTLAQQKFFAWLAQVQQQAGGGGGAEAAVAAAVAPRGRSTRRAASKARGRIAEHAAEEEDEEEEEEEEALLEEEEQEEEEQSPPRTRAKAKGGKDKGKGKKGSGAEPPARFSSFSLASFYSARSSDLQADDLRAGLKAFPIASPDAKSE